jgi:hypothetical protein
MYDGAYYPEKLPDFTDGGSLIRGADHLREGCVIRPAQERHDLAIGRVHLKLVSAAYLERSPFVKGKAA